jgi:hypothetical protein
MEVCTTAPHLSNPESNSSDFIGSFTDLCLKSGGNFVSGYSLVPEKSDDHSLIILHDKRTLNEF